MILDLTLDSVKFPGLENFTPPFGTKKADNVGLTTDEGCQNIAKPWLDQRPLIISENSSFSDDIERNGLIEIDTASITLTLNDATFKGCRLTILATFSSGTANLLHNSVTIPMAADSTRILEWTGTTWRNVNKSEIGAVQAYLGASDPDSKDWLVLDGRDTTGTALELATVYPRLYKFLGNTNVLPDYRGEFLRGAGTNSHTGEGNGGTVGQHQEGTRIRPYYQSTSNSFQLQGNNQDNVLNADSTVEEQVHYAGYGNGSIQGTATRLLYTTRPTNTSINWIICAR